MAKSFEYLIVGGGNSAGYACKELVAQGVEKGKVGMICAEPVMPYERPALTKAYLHPPSAKVRARLPGFHTSVGGGGENQGPEWYAEKGIEIVQGKAENMDLAAKTVKVGDTVCSYNKLFLATGCGSTRLGKFGLKGDDLPGVFYVRAELEAAALVAAMEALDGKGKVVIIGGGYIGLECAAALSGWGAEVTMVVSGSRVMPRLMDAELAGWLEDQYIARGVKMVKGDSGAEFVGDDKVRSVTLKSGNSLEADIVVVGVGASPITDYVQGLKMGGRGGFEVDGMMQTSDPSVYAIGDLAAFPSQYGGLTRCEHVDMARKSAAHAVQAAMGKNPEPFKYLPYFYSRLFEYTENPIVFNFFGSEDGEPKVFARGDKGLGAMWLDQEQKLLGALIIGSPGPSPEEKDKLMALVQGGPEVGAKRAKDVFTAAGL